MSPLRQRMLAALQRSGKGERTQEASGREVRLLSTFYKNPPPRISEAERQTSFLHRKQVDHLAPTSMRIRSSGLRCFSQHVLKRDGHTLSLIRAETAHRLPPVLRGQEVGRLLQVATPRQNRVSFTTLSRLGLRFHEGLCLQPPDIDSKRMMVHVHRGKGAKDRTVPLPDETLDLLRAYGTPQRRQDASGR